MKSSCGANKTKPHWLLRMYLQNYDRTGSERNSTKKFEDILRMTQLDIAFATRYLDAWDSYSKGKKCTNSWYFAFEAAKNKSADLTAYFPGDECTY